MNTPSNWATYTLREVPFWRDGMSPEEYDEEREYLGENYKMLQDGTYMPLWKQREKLEYPTNE